MQLIDDLKSLKEVIWYNPNYKKFEEVKDELPIKLKDVLDAEARLKRFAPYISRVFPQVKDGIIESGIDEISNMKNRMEERFDTNISGRLFL